MTPRGLLRLLVVACALGLLGLSVFETGIRPIFLKIAAGGLAALVALVEFVLMKGEKTVGDESKDGDGHSDLV